MSRLRVGVVGVGYLGWFHAQKYAGLEGVDLVGVADLDFARAEKAAQDFQTRPFRSHAELGGLVDAVSVAVTTSEHAKVASELLSQGIHCLVEKPLSATLAEADQIIASAEKGGAVLQVGHLERFNPAVAAIRDHLTSPVFMEARRLTTFRNRGLDVDVILDLMIHDIDIFLSLTGEMPVEAKAVGAAIVSQRPDVANARLEFPSGGVADLTASRISNSDCRQLQVFQADSHLRVDCANRTLTVFTKGPGPGEEILPGVRAQRREFPPADPLLAEIRAFVDAVGQGRPPLVGGREGRRALEVALKIASQVAPEPGNGG